jgi:putative copper export protein
MHGILLLMHLLSATVWTGGHLVLALGVLPRVLKQKSIDELSRYESSFERIGVPALLIQVVTGVWLAHRMVPDMAQWFHFANPVSRVILAKLSLLLLTVIFAADARLRIIPKLTENNLTSLVWHIVPVTLISVLFVVVGVSFRTGWFY